MSSYSDALDAPDAEAWRDLNEGDKLIGRVLGRDTRTGGQFGDYETVTVELTETSTQGGEEIEVGEARTVHCFGTILADRVEKLDPREGDLVGFKYEGVSKKSKPGQSPAKVYRVKVFERIARSESVPATELAAAAATTGPGAETFSAEDEQF